jgi:hypothetical protein
LVNNQGNVVSGSLVVSRDKFLTWRGEKVGETARRGVTTEKPALPGKEPVQDVVERTQCVMTNWIASHDAMLSPVWYCHDGGGRITRKAQTIDDAEAYIMDNFAGLCMTGVGRQRKLPSPTCPAPVLEHRVGGESERVSLPTIAGVPTRPKDPRNFHFNEP